MNDDHHPPGPTAVTACAQTIGDDVILPNFNWPGIVERQRREIEFLELLADHQKLEINGIYWRDAFERINELVSDPVPRVRPVQRRRRSPRARARLVREEGASG